MKLEPQQVVWICLMLTVGISVTWVCSFWLVAKFQPSQVRTILVEGVVLRMLTVAVIVVSTAMLALLTPARLKKLSAYDRYLLV